MLRDALYRVRAVLRRRAAEEDLDQELRFHFEKLVEKLVSAGISESEARRRARLEFGGIDEVKEECREAEAPRNWRQQCRTFDMPCAVCGATPG
jgi:hypothetical protein